MQAGCEMRTHRQKADSAVEERSTSNSSCSVLEPKNALAQYSAWHECLKMLVERIWDQYSGSIQEFGVPVRIERQLLCQVFECWLSALRIETAFAFRT
jgi:hypothetical protein